MGGEAQAKRWPKWGKMDPAPAEVLQAVTLSLKGEDNYYEIARVMGFEPTIDAHKIRRDVDRYFVTSRGDPDVERDRQQTVSKWRNLEKELWLEYRNHQGNGNVRLGILRELGDLAKRIAGTLGVSTEKTTQDLNVNGKLNLEDMPQEERDELARLAAKASNGKAP